jgi:Tol biopolymer transport system component
VVNLDGSGERSILGEMRKAKGPDWSPDGTLIVLNLQEGGRLEEKTVCRLLVDLETGQKITPDVPANAGDITFKMKDGLPYLCWELPPDAHWSLRAVNVADGSFQDLYGGTYAFRPAWDPANDWRIVADSGYGLVETDVNRDSSQGITDELREGSPAFSPDGRYIATAVAHGGIYEIHRLKGDGSGRVRLTETPLWVTARPGDQNAWNNVAPVWSPNGTRIAFVTDRTGRWEIWVMNADGSDQRPMFPDAINDQIQIAYDFKDERVLSWR